MAKYMTFRVAVEDLPPHGENVLISDQGYTLLIEADQVNQAEPEPVVLTPLPFHFAVAKVANSRVVHAVRVHHRQVYNVRERHTLCSRNKSRAVIGSYADQPLGMVSCLQYVGHLAEAGVL